jgi:squalene cyclase
VWVEHDNTQVVQTSWAAMALMYAKYPHTKPIEKAVALVMSRQLPVRKFSTSRHIVPPNGFSGRLMGTGSYRRYL